MIADHSNASIAELLSHSDIAALEELQGFLRRIPTFLSDAFLNSPEKYRCLFTGNRFGKTDMVAMEYVLRYLGIHPIAKKNFTRLCYHHNQNFRMIRFASETLPSDKEGDGEAVNTQYPALLRYLPRSCILKNITARNHVIALHPQAPLAHGKQKPKPLYIEFVSYNQQIQRQAGVERASVWMDEHAPWLFFDESRPRVYDTMGDIILTLTPALEMISWEYDFLYTKASRYIRTEAVCKRLYERFGEDATTIEVVKEGGNIAVFQAATLDNPILASDPEKRKLIEEEYALMDEDDIDVRAYGIFRQRMGLIFKMFKRAVHAIDGDQYFPGGMPKDWTCARLIDYHQNNDWAILWVAMSPGGEAFVYDELKINPNNYVLRDIAEKMLYKSGDTRFRIDLVDPLSDQNDPQTHKTGREALNEIFTEFKRAGVGTGANFVTWDTKGDQGRQEIKARLHNALEAGSPFKNTVDRFGTPTTVPTLWVFSRCRNTIESLANWQWDQPISLEHYQKKDRKEKPQQKYSHFCTCLEALFKDKRFRAGSGRIYAQPNPYDNKFRRAS